MAVPKKKVSPGRKKIRRQFYELTATEHVKCPNCLSTRRPHRVCGTCGFYNGRQVIQITAKETQASA